VVNGEHATCHQGRASKLVPSLNPKVCPKFGQKTKLNKAKQKREERAKKEGKKGKAR